MFFLINQHLNYDYHSLTCIIIRSILSLLTSFFFNIYIGKFFINCFKKLKIYQIIRKNGPKTHFLKKNTPTMGGLFVIISILTSIILYSDLSNFYIWSVISVLIGYGLIGFIDDYKKIKCNNSKGIPLKWKYFWLSIVSLIFEYSIYIYGQNITPHQFIIPFFHKIVLHINYFNIFLSYFVVVGTSNAVNLTDGLDGLAIFPLILLACGFAFISLLTGYSDYSDIFNIFYIRNSSELTILCASIAGSGLGFLWFNTYPSQIFMGDVGSLSLGGSLGAIAVLLHQEFLLIIMGIVFIIETISVILQIISFKIRKKRIFLMAPIHHHYEIKGLPEPIIIIRFWIISFLSVLIGIASIKVH
ncbi:phospho-N-acetylmuramoyl-pentapeptide-transferase [Buchnera aphidicola (Muscaphis stroyani)]|uniref:Phospho-N-acetylmuramoyl-pentapeptide-transferase n=1 Tax=Buchnera aphidicola (Muscaphis stroyani) TaxID=1241869 RepID=A0A4D6Y3V1_9GAMM|nr:phospho-N-acetylmuramoyl-pentapeptide-transferase [Buchnera aphidicola]QCI24306.1 phospho-N-acetylmuramoyl-pentapeptide-transferase [Buchnera aphidicola (Muscaphis stroyani)]